MVNGLLHMQSLGPLGGWVNGLLCVGKVLVVVWDTKSAGYETNDFFRGWEML